MSSKLNIAICTRYYLGRWGWVVSSKFNMAICTRFRHDVVPCGLAPPSWYVHFARPACALEYSPLLDCLPNPHHNGCSDLAEEHVS